MWPVMRLKKLVVPRSRMTIRPCFVNFVGCRVGLGWVVDGRLSSPVIYARIRFIWTGGLLLLSPATTSIYSRLRTSSLSLLSKTLVVNVRLKNPLRTLMGSIFLPLLLIAMRG